jgi:23S rRNA pseudouridine1911/1915/1917 synthase
MRAPRVLHEDNHLLVLEKPACLPCVPDESGDASLLEWGKQWVKRTRGKPGAVFLGVVHRLDRPVSGVVVFARTSKAAERLSAQFRERSVEKVYVGIVDRAGLVGEGCVEQWLVKDRSANLVHVAAEGDAEARLATTEWRVVEQRGDRTLLELRPRTGRAHQLRLACKFLGAPLCGDVKYGAAQPLSDKSIALHAARIGFDHPTQKERLEFSAPLPGQTIWEGWET